MATGTEIYESALVLMDANNDADTSDYESKALELINNLMGEVFPYSDNYNEQAKLANETYKQTGVLSRPICPKLNDLDDTLSLDEYICRTVLPHAVAAYMLMDENPSTANTLLQRYYELLNSLKRGEGMPVFGSEDIEDAYSRNGKSHYYYNRFTVWGGC